MRLYIIVATSPLILGQISGFGMRVSKLFNLVGSNVVATRSKLYLNGAELEAMYPISILFDGYALNITTVGYADRLEACLAINGDLNGAKEQTLAIHDTGEPI
ncbi:hypothetical protein Kalk_08070 [Ketobacter alkanivorans]|uniref:O-acyltransferase WSD1 C-terminal domain-containing protein n=1 Tax=Ketobacter alkanivorans TaxID=1917421 RepID=A0A2K9LJD4_9GAMM|nr:hypothetical protein Kalk_08070 [Ketobacter alkanivorans]